MDVIYLDNNATTQPSPEVLEAMLPCFREFFGNASSIHTVGQRARHKLDEARDSVAALLGADPAEIVFTGGGTESDNLAIKGVALAGNRSQGHIITSKVEHHAVLNTCAWLETRGFEVSYLPVDSYGLVRPDDVARAIRDDTILITIMFANNEVGTIQPISEIGRIARKRGIPFHTDAVQAAGKISIHVDEMNLDLLTLSGHKIYGPKGVGALYIRRGTKIEPILHGGHHEGNRRAGTENIPGIVGLGKACEIAARDMAEEAGRLTGLRDELERGIRARIEDVAMNGHPSQRLPNTLNMSFGGVEGESLLLSLDLCGIAVSTGSACTSGSSEPSHVLRAMNVPAEMMRASLRFSLGSGNTREQMERTVDVLADAVEKLRRTSPFFSSRSRS